MPLMKSFADKTEVFFWSKTLKNLSPMIPGRIKYLSKINFVTPFKFISASFLSFLFSFTLLYKSIQTSFKYK